MRPPSISMVATLDSELATLSRRELQALAKEHGIKANSKSAEIISALEEKRAKVSPTAASDGGDSDPRMDRVRQMVKAKRVQAAQGLGGLRSRKGAKRSERKKVASGKGFGRVPAAGLNFDRRPKAADAACACGSGDPYQNCCAPLHGSGAPAPTPEALVRARYSAYAYRLPQYLIDTTDPDGEEWQQDLAAWKRELLGYCDKFEFQKLKLDDDAASVGGGDADEAVVGFRANILQKGTINLMALREHSTVRKCDGRWLYTKGDVDYESPED
jgi:SEC-C motif-containing protein